MKSNPHFLKYLARNQRPQTGQLLAARKSTTFTLPDKMSALACLMRVSMAGVISLMRYPFIVRLCLFGAPGQGKHRAPVPL